MNKILNKSRGQIAVLYAGIIVALVGAIALGADVSVMYMNWQQSQKVADAAAQAGANFLTGVTYTGAIDPTCTHYSPDTAEEAACTYAVKNGLLDSNITISEPPSAIRVVALQSDLPYFFAKVLGVSNYSVSATAQAAASGPPVECDSCGLVPLGLDCPGPCTDSSGFVAGQAVSFGTKFVSSTIDLKGNWDWVDLGGKGGKTLGDNIASGADGTYSVGDTIQTKPGGTNGQVTKGLNTRFKGCPAIADPCSGGNPTDIPAGDPCLVIVPVVDFAAATKNGSTNLTIEAFAEVYLESTGPNATTGTHINGCFVSAVVGNTVTGSAGSTPRPLGPTAPPVLTQ